MNLSRFVFSGPRGVALVTQPPCTATTFHIGSAIDIAEEHDVRALRRVARARSTSMGPHGDELLLIGCNVGGAVLALNLLLNLNRLSFSHHMVLGYDSALCLRLGEAASHLAAIRGTPCLFDSMWERFLARSKVYELHRRVGEWLARWRVMARLLRLGYNVLSLDTDTVLLEDPYPHFHSRATCGRFVLLFGAEVDTAMHHTALQNGVVYVCGARRDGAAAWLMAETVDRALRLADSCGGSFDNEPANATTCDAGSWLHAARLLGDFTFDQRLHADVLHSAATRDGRHWWRTLGHLLTAGWPYADTVANGSGAKLVERLHAALRASGAPQLRVLKAPRRPAPQVGRSTGLGLHGAKHKASLSGGSTRLLEPSWFISPLVDEDAMLGGKDISSRWAERFSLDRSGFGSNVLWVPLGTAPPLAATLPPQAGWLVDSEWQRMCITQSSLTSNSSNSSSDARAWRDRSKRLSWKAAMQARDELLARTAAPHTRAPDGPVGVLPSGRGPLSRAWQRTLREDLAAAGCSSAPLGDQRRAVPLSKAIKHGGEGGEGAGWAPSPDGDEAAALLPSWLVTYWSVAKQGLVGTVLPTLVIFHATNAYDKLLAFAGHGLLDYAALHAEPRAGTMGYTDRLYESTERRLFIGGARPPIVAFAPTITAQASADALLSATVDEYLTHTVGPLLIAAAISGRLPLLPSVPCSCPWLRTDNTPEAAVPRPAFGKCRTGSCSFRCLAVGAVSRAELAKLEELKRAFNHSSPFPQVAEEVSRRPLHCVPMAGIFGGRQNWLVDGRCRAGAGGYLLHPPMAEKYLKLLGAAASIANSAVISWPEGVAQNPGSKVPRLNFSTFEGLVTAQHQHSVLYLPSQVHVTGVPARLQEKLRWYCSRTASSKGPLTLWPLV